MIARAVDAANNTNSASTNPKWATRTISVTPDTITPVTNGTASTRNGTPSQGGSSAILANTAPTLQVTNPVADTTDEAGDVAGAATVNKDSEDKGEVLAARRRKGQLVTNQPTANHRYWRSEHHLTTWAHTWR